MTEKERENNRKKELSDLMLGEKFPFEFSSKNSGNTLIPAGSKITKEHIEILTIILPDHLEIKYVCPFKAKVFEILKKDNRREQLK